MKVKYRYWLWDSVTRQVEEMDPIAWHEWMEMVHATSDDSDTLWRFSVTREAIPSDGGVVSDL